MKIELWCIGPTRDKYLQQGIADYLKRLKHYHSFSMLIIASPKGDDRDGAKSAEKVIKLLRTTDALILLDEYGEMFDSMGFARHLDKLFHRSYKRLIFLVGGAFGFHKSLHHRADKKISLSMMTFSHQMVRLIFVEQLYRAFTILGNEPYHHQ